MTTSISLGRILGIRIGINWSWLVVFALIAWTLASGIFPDTNPGLRHGTYVLMAIVASVLFFASLLLHELGHAVQARREGMEIEGITLWLFGGVAKFKGMFPSAGAEFRIAIAGPLVSLALGLLFALGAWAISTREAVDGVAAWLGYINPDAARLQHAARTAARRGPRAALGALAPARKLPLGDARGCFDRTRLRHPVHRGRRVPVPLQGAFSGAWLAFIGWFLFQAATSEDRYLLVKDALGDLRVRDLMVRDPVTVEPHMSIGRFMDQVAWSRRYTTYPIVENGHAVGLLSFRGVTSVPRAEWDTQLVGQSMIGRERVPTLRADESAVDALAELSQGEVNRGFVLEGDRLVGFLSITDLARALEVARAQRRLAHGRSRLAHRCRGHAVALLRLRRPLGRTVECRRRIGAWRPGKKRGF